MKLPPFIAPGSDIPVTEEELTERKLKIQKLQEIGIGIVTKEKIRTDYKRCALSMTVRMFLYL